MNEEQLAREFTNILLSKYVTTSQVRRYLSRHYSAELARDPLLASRVQAQVKKLRV